MPHDNPNCMCVVSPSHVYASMHRSWGRSVTWGSQRPLTLLTNSLRRGGRLSGWRLLGGFLTALCRHQDRPNRRIQHLHRKLHLLWKALAAKVKAAQRQARSPRAVTMKAVTTRIPRRKRPFPCRLRFPSRPYHPTTRRRSRHRLRRIRSSVAQKTSTGA